MALTVSEYIDKVYKNKEVIHTYKTHDTEGNRRYWNNYKINFCIRYGNMDCRKEDFDSLCEFVGDEK